jgi:hypothetical protein
MPKGHLIPRLIIVYELCRFPIIAASHPLQSIYLLPVSWFVAAPLLALPCILAFLLLYDEAHFPAYRNLYVFKKWSSALGILRYGASALFLIGENESLVTKYSLRLLAFLLIFFVIDVILAIYEFTRKGGG